MFNLLSKLCYALADLIDPPVLNVPTYGWEAYKRGFKLSANPFKKHTWDHSIWRDDWLDCEISCKRFDDVHGR